MKPESIPATRPVSPGSRRVWTSVLAAAFLSLAAGVFLRFFANDLESYTLCADRSSIYTVNDAEPRADCIVVRNARVVRTIRFEEGPRLNLPVWPFDWVKPRSRVLRTRPGSIVVPGLADAHAHLIEYGAKMQLPLDGARSVKEVLERVAAYVHAHPDVLHDKNKFIEGWGWDEGLWPGAELPTAEFFRLDPLLGDRPIALRRVDGHAVWVSPKVMHMMGDLPQEVEGGLIVRDADGKATGIFLDNAMQLVPLPSRSEEQMAEFFEIATKDALAHGLTSVHDADASPEMIHLFQKLADEGKLPLRIYAMGHVQSNQYWGQKIPRLLDYGVQGRLTVRGIKLYTDGALGSRGAALLEPYTDKPKTSGVMMHSPAGLRELVRQFLEDGWQVNTHCIGDRANNVLLNIFEDLATTEGFNLTERRPRIEHAQIMTLDDLERTGRLGVIPSVQPTHATSDMWYAEARLGPERIKGAYAYRSLFNSSIYGILAIGSDFPVESVNPLLGFYAAVSRLSVDGTSPHGSEGWYPDQALTRAQALKGMTFDAAYAAFMERDLGSLAPGKKADFVVIDRDIMILPITEALNAKVLATVIDGEVVYGSLD